MRSFFRSRPGAIGATLLVLVAAVACEKPTQPGAPALTLRLAAQPALLPAAGGQTTLTATLLTAAGIPVSGAAVTFTATAGTLSAAEATTNEAGVATVQLTSTRPAKVTATAKTGRIASFLESPTLDVQITVDTALTMEVSPASPRRGDLVTIAITATSGGQPVAGTLVVALGDGETRNLGTVTGGATLTHTYRNQGTFAIVATFTRENRQHTRTAQVEVRGFAPGVDQIDPREITWLSQVSTDVTNWAITSTVTGVDQGGDNVCVYHTKSGQWPLVSIDNNPPNLEANMLIVVNIGGRWYGAGFDWLRPGQTCKNLTAVEYGRDQIRAAPLDASWPGPRRGDEVGLLVSAPSSNRVPVRSVSERSNIVRVIWQ